MRASRLLMAAAALGLLLAWLLFLRPTVLGGPVTYVQVRGDSMEPTLSSGDLAVLRNQDGYGPGDIVAFRVPEGEPGEGAIVIHRIVRATPDNAFVMQGDNKERPDPWRPSEGDILGKVWFTAPGGGRFLAFLRAPLPLATLAGILAIGLVLGTGKKRPDSRGVAAAASKVQD